MTAVKIKFGDATSDTERMLPCADETNHSFSTRATICDVGYRFDLGSSLYLRLTVDGQWFNSNDIDELISFLKAAKKLKKRHVAVNGF